MESGIDDTLFFPLERNENFNLLEYVNDDDSLIAALGIESTPVSEICTLKSLDADTANTYADLVPPTPPQQGNFNFSTYYTIDIEVPRNSSSEFEDSPPPLQQNTTNVFLTYEYSPFDNCVSPTAETCSPSNTLQGPSDIFVSGAECETDPPIIIAVKDPTLETPPEVINTSIKSVTPNETEPKVKAPAKRPRRRNRPRKEKIYEILKPLPDPDLEKKRLNAINAKKNRDRKKQQVQELDKKVRDVTVQRDRLRAEVEKLKEQEQQLRKQLEEKYKISLPIF